MRRWRRSDSYCPVDQVANGPDSGVDLTPASDAPALTINAAWLPTLPHQAIPMIGERIYDEPCECE